MHDANPANPLVLSKDIVIQNDFANAQLTDTKTIPVIDLADAIYTAAINPWIFLYLEPWNWSCPHRAGVCSL